MNKIIEYSEAFWKIMLDLKESELLEAGPIRDRIYKHQSVIENYVAGRTIYGPDIPYRQGTIDFSAGNDEYSIKPKTRYISTYVPMHEELPLPLGTEYFVPNPCYKDGFMRAYWQNSSSDRAFLTQGWVYTNKFHAKEFLVLTRLKNRV